MNSAIKLDVLSLGKVNGFVKNVTDYSYTVKSPAVEFLTDFTLRKPIIIEAETNVNQAIDFMKKSHVKLMLVVDREENFHGIVSINDLHSVKVMRAAVNQQKNAGEVTVADVMTDKNHLHGLTYLQLMESTIGQVIDTLQDLGEQHILVLCEDESTVRGLISASDIARKLHIDIQISNKANSFSDIYSVLKVS